MNTELIKYSQKYRGLLEKALKTIKRNIKNESFLKEIEADYLSMAKNYLHDGIVFQEKGDHIRALACFSYAYAWIDAGVRIGVFYGIDRNLFTLYK